MDKPLGSQDADAAAETIARSTVDEFDLRGIGRIICRRKWLITGTILFVTVLTVAFAFSATPRYTANLALAFEPKLGPAVDFEAALNRQPQDEASILNEIEILKSRELAKSVVEKLHLSSLAEFNPELADESRVRQFVRRNIPWAVGNSGSSARAGDFTEEQLRSLKESQIIDRFLERLDVKLVGRSRAVEVSYTTEQPALAADIANAVIELYLLARFEFRLENARRASQWLATHVQQLRENVEQAEHAVEDYRRQHNLFQGERSPLISQQISDLSAKLTNASADRGVVEIDLAQAKRLRGKADVSSLGQVLHSELIQRLREEEVSLDRREAEMGERYGPRHPLMIQIKAEKEKFREKIGLEVDKIVRNLETQAQVARARERGLSKDLSALKEEMSRDNSASVTLRTLERDASANRLLLEKFMNAFIETSAHEDARSEVSDARVISRAAIPDHPSFPQKSLIIILGFLGGAIVSFPLAFGAEAFDSSYRSAEQIESDMGLPVLAHVPRTRGKQTEGQPPEAYALSHPESAYAEAIRSLYTRLLIAGIDYLPRSIVLVSSEPDEGKTTIALSMAGMLTKAGRKVLLIDADLRRSEIADKLQLAPGPGLSELLADSATLENVIQRAPQAGCDVIVSGGYAPNSADLLASRLLAISLEKVERQYDFVLIDSPPLMALSDARLLASAASTTIVVLRWGVTRRQVARYTVEQIKGTARSVAGIVLSKVDIKSNAGYGYGDSVYYAGKKRTYYHA